MKDKRITGILNKGKNNNFINNQFAGVDIAIQDEGENTTAINNKFFNSNNRITKWYQAWWFKLLCKILITIICGLVIAFFTHRMNW